MPWDGRVAPARATNWGGRCRETHTALRACPTTSCCPRRNRSRRHSDCSTRVAPSRRTRCWRAPGKPPLSPNASCGGVWPSSPSALRTPSGEMPWELCNCYAAPQTASKGTQTTRRMVSTWQGSGSGPALWLYALEPMALADSPRVTWSHTFDQMRDAGTIDVPAHARRTRRARRRRDWPEAALSFFATRTDTTLARSTIRGILASHAVVPRAGQDQTAALVQSPGDRASASSGPTKSVVSTETSLPPTGWIA